MTVLVITFDEWGGFFEQVPPPRVNAANDVDTDIVEGKTLRRFRVPVVIASPFGRGDGQNPRISSLAFDHTSVLKLIKWRWGLPPLTPRDGGGDVHNLAYALNFQQTQNRGSELPRPEAPAIAPPCFQNLARVYGPEETRSGAGPSSAAKTAK